MLLIIVTTAYLAGAQPMFFLAASEPVRQKTEVLIVFCAKTINDL